MIQVNELMGNYFIGYDNKIIKWDLIHFDLLITACCEINEIIKEPIPITEEWLLEFGFEETYNSEFRHKFDHKVNHFIGYDFSKVEDKSMDGFRYYGIYIKINYIHELQNLYFALTKQELTIV